MHLSRLLASLCFSVVAVVPSLFAAEPAKLDAAGTRAAFLKLIDHPRVPLDPREEAAPAPGDGLTRLNFSYATEPGQRVPAILIKPAGRTRLPVVIALHGTSGTKEGQVGFMTTLAKAGFLTISIDGRYHGARSKAGTGSVEYVQAILQTYRTGKEHPLFYDTVWDLMRLIDYLETRDDVDAKRIGLYGTSKGGIEAYLTAAVDPRVAVAVPCISVQSFRWAMENNSWQSRIGTVQAAFDGAAKDEGIQKPGADFVRKFYDRTVPGIYDRFDGPAMVPLIAPRPLLAINGDSDPRTPRPGLDETGVIISRAYAAAGAPEKFVLHLQPNTGHKVTPEAVQMAQAWFIRWLKP